MVSLRSSAREIGDGTALDAAIDAAFAGAQVNTCPLCIFTYPMLLCGAAVALKDWDYPLRWAKGYP